MANLDISGFDPTNALKDMEARRQAAGPSLSQSAHSGALKAILASAALGIGVGGTAALVNSWMENKSQEEEEEKLRPGGTKYLRLHKRAGEGGGTFQELKDMVKRYYRGIKGPVREAWEDFTSVTEPADVPYMAAGVGAGALGGAYGGYKILDQLLDSRRNRQMDDKITQARAEFNRTLAPRREEEEEKAASVSDFDSVLNKLASDFSSKEGIFKEAGAGSKMLNLYLAMALALGGGGYYLGKSFADKQDPARAKLKALKLAQGKKFKTSPVRIKFLPSIKKRKQDKKTKLMGASSKEPVKSLFDEEEGDEPGVSKAAALAKKLLI